MGLAGQKTKQRFGLDPRNTNWSNDNERFGTQYLQRLGWKPGSGLGLVSHALTSHVKVAIKDDRVGLGSKLAKKHKNIDAQDDIVGLDVFQRILGKLNGKEEQISDELERQRKEKIISGKWGISFVKAETLESTWDRENKKYLLNNGTGKKRSKSDLEGTDSEESENESDSVYKKKKQKKEKREKKEKKESKKLKKLKGSKEIKDKKDKTDKTDKKDKKDKKDRKEKKEKKDRKEKKEKKGKIYTDEKKSDGIKKDTERIVNTRLAARSRYIRQKKAATMDSQALKEIFYIAPQ